MATKNMTNNWGGWVTKTSVPLRGSNTNASEHLGDLGDSGCGRGIKNIKTMATLTSKKNVPCDPILNKKMKRVKLNKDIIIKSKFLNR
jgi:hypothetical protein